MITKKLLIGFSMLSFVTTHVYADGVPLWFEPGITLESGKTTVTYPRPYSQSTGNANGLGLVGKAGFHIGSTFFFGLDGRYARLSFKDKDPHYSASANSINWGPTAGVKIPLLGIRFWGTAILNGTLNPERSENLDVKFKDGKGYRLGAGIKLLLVSLNLEYQHIKYSETILEQVGPFASGSTVDDVHLQQNSVIASVTVPFEL